MGGRDKLEEALVRQRERKPASSDGCLQRSCEGSLGVAGTADRIGRGISADQRQRTRAGLRLMLWDVINK